MGGWVTGSLILPWLLVIPSLAQVRHPLPVLWITPRAGWPGQENLTAAVLPAVQLALQDLSRQPPPLRNYEIKFDVIESECDNAKGLKAFFDAIWNGPKYSLVFGGVCPSVTSTIAQSLQNWNLVQLSFAPGERYPNLFCTVPSDSSVGQAVVQLLIRYKWRRVGVLTDERRLSEKDLTEKLREANIEVVVTERLSNGCAHLKKLKDNDVRIIVGLFDEQKASEVFCCAHSLNMFDRKYQWIIPSGYKEGWWEESNISNCSSESLLTSIEGYFSVDLEHLSDRQIKGISGRTSHEYEETYRKLLRKKVGLAASKVHGFAYDSVWVIATALTQVMETIKRRERYDIHRNFTVSTVELEQMVLRSMNQISFEGVTGRVLFQNGERMGRLKLSQFQGVREEEVGEYDTRTDVLKINTHKIRFQGPGPAKDRTIIRLLGRSISVVLYSILSAINGLAIISAVTFVFFNIKNRNHRFMKTTGQFLDNLLVLGTILSYTSIFIFGLDGFLVPNNHCQILCSIRTWFLSIGYTITFGALFAKIWRVYTNKEMDKKNGTARPPLEMVGILLLTDLAILSCWQVVDPLRLTKSEYGWETDPSDEDITIRPYTEGCQSTRMNLWLTIVYGYKGPVMLLGCFLAWRIRNMQAPPFNDSMYLGGSMFILTALCVGGVSGCHVTSHLPSVQFCILTLTILLCNTCTLCLLFVPKILLIRNNPDEVSKTSGLQPALQKKDSASLGSLTNPDQDLTSDQPLSLLENLHMENQCLRRRITQLDSELETMALLLQEHPEQGLGVQDGHMTHRGSRVYFKETSGKVRSPTQLELQAQSLDDVFESLSDINSPDQVQRRLSIQLPILHHAYLPAIGGVNASHSSLLNQA